MFSSTKVFDTPKIIVMILLVIILTIIGSDNIHASSHYKIEYTGKGTVSIKTGKEQKNMRVQVQKGETKYNYIYNKPEIEVPLQLGAGNYTIKVLSLIQGNTYRVVHKENINYKGDISDSIIFVQSTNKIDWKDHVEFKIISDELVKEEMSDLEKIKVVYNYITKYISYDYAKVKTLTPTYMPQINETLVNRKGICYDYASLFAGVMRYNNIPTKLVTGYSVADKNTYHAWNEVFIDGEWKILDLTQDATYIRSNIQVDMFKKTEQFIKDKEY